jgi:peptidoglycan/LPS O-acetylase OafA/YrhL
VAIALLFTTFIDLGVGQAGFQSVHVDARIVLAHVAFLQEELYPKAVGFSVNPILWTVSLIVIFYALMPLVAGRYLKHPILGLLLAVAACSTWRVLTRDNIDLFLQFPVYMTSLGLGMSAAVAYVWLHRRFGRQRLRPWALPVFALAGAGLIAVLYFNGRGFLRGEHPRYADPVPYSILIPALFLTLVVSSAFASRWVQWPLANPVSRWLGGVSYALFLYHAFAGQLLIHADPSLFRNGTLGAMVHVTAIVVPFSLIAAWLGTEALERPLRARARRLARRYEGEAEAPPPGRQPEPAVAD